MVQCDCNIIADLTTRALKGRGRSKDLKLKPTEPLAHHHSWFLDERRQRFDLGYVLDSWATAIREPAGEDDLARHGVGRWQCDLADNALSWSDAVFDIFGLPRGARLTRDETVALYCEGSRAALERLRAYAIQHKRGFTLDAEIRPGQGGPRWMRLIAAPVLDGGQVVRLHGLKRII
jgi:PAS domain-containing protein